ncbi:HYR domain-containing protein, partial [Saprospiraceae bacterium]|nr:HYR domain-containing protein [Saprospiraceae bacterium]
WFDENDNGVIDGDEMGIEGVSVELHWYNPETMMCEVLEILMTDMDGLFLFDSLVAGQYMVMIPDTDLGPGGVLQDFQSTTGTFNMGGIYEDVMNPIDGNGDIDNDDNGVLGLNSNFPTYVASDTLTLGGDPEPIGEDPDNDNYTNDVNENLSLDFGFVDKVYDVALTKTTMMMTGNSFGDTINFMIKVVNQGNTPLTNIEVTDYIATGFAPIMGLNTAVTDAGGTGWIDNMDMTATYTIGDTLAPNEEVYVNFFVEIMMSEFSNAFVNRAEVSMFQDTIGNSTDGTGPYVGGIEDEDSTPDSTVGNDAGGEPGSEADDYINGDGTGDDGDGVAATDEDDEDPALIQVIDIALTKTIVDGQAPFSYGTPVEFEIIVENQGNEPLFDLTVSDYIPTGYTYDTLASDAEGWSYDGLTATTTITDTLEMWDTDTLYIWLTPQQIIPSTDSTAWTNVAEVSQMFALDINDTPVDVSDLDIDSDSDYISNNDPGGNPLTDSDDTTSGNGTDGGGSPGDTDAATDEDDADPALLPIFDLALTKQLVFPDSIYSFGDEIEFVIEVINQGNTVVTDIDIVEYVPGSLTEVGVLGDNTGWDFGASPASYTITDELLPGDTIQVSLFMVFQMTMGGIEEYINVSEISEFADTLGNNSTDNPDIVFDADSSPDAIEDNDEGGEPDFPGSMSGTDNTVDNENGDEDDHDPVLLGFVDMALAKTLVNPTTPVQIGDDVTFEIEVTNQGTIPMINIEVIDYIPPGFELSVNDTNGWTIDVDGNARDTITGPLGFAESDTLQIVLTVLPNANEDNLINVAEIVEFYFPSGMEATDLDIDSQGDTLSMNDPGGNVYEDSNDAVDGDGTGAVGDEMGETDEDDADPAVPAVLDLALIKTIADGTPAVRPGDVVTFEIEVCNQGNIPVEGVTIYDDIPTGLVKLASSTDGWSFVQGNTWEFTIEERILRDSCVTIEIELEVLAESTAAQMINVAEIAQVIDTSGVDVSDLDIDSTPNNDDGEAEGTFNGPDDNSTDGSVPNGEDSDDADPAAPPVFDLAIQKINPLMDTPSDFGDIIPFEITVFNQGNMIAQEIEVADYIPEGLEFVADATNDEWTTTDGILYSSGVNELLPGQDSTIILHLRVKFTATPMNVVNMAEVSGAVDTSGVQYNQGGLGNEYDSELDDSNTNDVGNDIYDLDNDNVLDEFGIGHGLDGVDDEDDHDQAWVNLCMGIVCKQDINISLDETCMTEITPSMLLEGDLFPDHIYEISAMNSNGEIVDAQQFDGDDIGETFVVTICNPLCDNNCCTVNVKIEDKFPPQIACVSDTITCGELIVFPEPMITENCSGAILTMLNETYANVDCSDPELQQIITREWIATDVAGNVSNTCTQTLSISKFDIGTVEAPAETQIALECGVPYPTDANGGPDPIVYGSPRLGGQNLWPSQFLVCNLMVNYSDQTLQTSQNETSIVRTWTGTTWYCGQDSTVQFVQVFVIADNEGPEFTCPGDMSFSSSGINCTADVVLPTLSISDLCGDVVDVDVQYEGGFIENSNGGNASLPMGTSVVTYTATDSNGNKNSCSFNVSVSDNEQPITICEQFTTINLANDGLAIVTAEMFDDGSFDACGPVTLTIRRMTPSCDMTDAAFGETVTFCCEDIGVEQMVVLRATDQEGNFNECMVSATIDDKIPPVLIQGLPDITLSCEFPFNEMDTEQFGSIVMDEDDIEPILLTADLVQFSGPATDGLVIGNCIELLDDEFTFSNFNSCGIGSATRILIFTNAQGLTVTDVQNITFVNPSPFTIADIDFPDDYSTTNLCDVSQLLPGNLAAAFSEPTFVEDGCDQIGFDYEDSVTDFSEGAMSCYEIIRTWTVADWCQTVNGQFATWEGQQILTVTNTIAPEITGDCSNRELCSYDVECGPMYIELLNAGMDDCTDSAFLNWTYMIDFDSDNTIDVTGNTADASGTYPIGIHTISWILTDGCGNQDDCSYTFELKNCKTATPICLQNLTAEIIATDTDGDFDPDTEQVTVNVNMFDGGSYHVCGSAIQLSFSADVNDVERIYGCDDVGEQPIQLWVTDVNGNQDFCITSLDVQNNTDEGLCPAMLTVDVVGDIYTEIDEMIAKTEVMLEGGGTSDMTEEDGHYDFFDMPTGGSYVINPAKDIEHINGITTLDIILIQKHILGLETLDSPFKMIAADVNKSDNITGQDIILLRKLILGQNANFPGNTSWRFIDADHIFLDPYNPWITDLPESYNIDNLAGDMIVNFTGVKVGDVNNSAQPNELVGEQLDTRSNDKLNLAIDYADLTKGSTQWIAIYADEFTNMSGMQIGLSLSDNVRLLDVRGAALELVKSNYTINSEKNELAMIWHNADVTSVSSEKALFEVQVEVLADVTTSRLISTNDEVIRNEAYDQSLQIADVAITTRRADFTNELMEISMEMTQNEPNPWNATTTIEINVARGGRATFRVMDMSGKVVYTQAMDLEAGVNELLLTKDALPTNGVLYYEIEMAETKLMKKMVLLK